MNNLFKSIMAFTLKSFKKIKTFFDYTHTSLLGIMSLIVSVNSCILSERQVENEERLNMPLIEVRSSKFTFKETNDSEEVTIKNIGKFAKFYDVKKNIFLECIFTPKRSVSNEPIKRLYIPINDLLDSSFPKHDYEGVIDIKMSIGTYKYVDDLIYETTKVTNGFLNITLLQYIVVKYYDFKDILHEDIFLVKPGLPSTRVDYNDHLYELFKLRDHHSIQELSIEKIIELIKTQGEEIVY
jgi:hypothetical protein